MKFNGTKIPKLPSILTEEIGSPLPKEPNGQDPWASEIVRNYSKSWKFRNNKTQEVTYISALEVSHYLSSNKSVANEYRSDIRKMNAPNGSNEVLDKIAKEALHDLIDRGVKHAQLSKECAKQLSATEEMITNAAHTTHRLVEEYNKLPTARDDTGKIRKIFDTYEDEINMHKMALVELRNDLLNGRCNEHQFMSSTHFHNAELASSMKLCSFITDKKS